MKYLLSLPKDLGAFALLFVCFTLCLPGASGQTFSGTGTRSVIGSQTTALGVTYYGNAAPNVTPSAANWRTVVRFHVDTSAQVQWAFLGSTWKAQGVIRRVTPPPATATNGSATLDYRYAQWQADGDSTRYTYDFQEGCWSPLGVYRHDTIPTNVASGVGTGAVCYEFSPWLNTDNDSLYLYQDGTWLSVGTGSGGGGSGVDNFYRDGDTLRLAAGVDTFSVSAVEPDSAIYATLTTLADSMAIVRDSIDALRADIGTGGGSGTVTSVGLALPTAVFDVSGSPVTSSGTLTATFDTQANNSVFAGPSSGGPSTPSFRVPGATDVAAWGGTTGTGAANNIALWTGTSTLGQDASQFWWNSSNNYLGLGTNNPQLDIESVSNVNNVRGLFINNTNTGTNARNFFGAATGNNQGFIQTFASGYTSALWGGTYIANSVIFGRYDGGTSSGRLLIGNTGNSATKTIEFHIGNSTTFSAATMLADMTTTYGLQMYGTNAIILHNGTTAQRPTGIAGALRGNSTTLRPDYHNGTAWRQLLDLPDATPTTNHVPYWTGSAWATGAVSSLFTDTNIGNTDLTTSASLRVLTVGTNSSLIIRGQGLNSAIRISDGTAGEQVSLYSSNEVNVQSADTLTVSTDDGNSLVMIPNKGVTVTSMQGAYLSLTDTATISAEKILIRDANKLMFGADSVFTISTELTGSTTATLRRSSGRSLFSLEGDDDFSENSTEIRLNDTETGQTWFIIQDDRGFGSDGFRLEHYNATNYHNSLYINKTSRLFHVNNGLRSSGTRYEGDATILTGESRNIIRGTSAITNTDTIVAIHYFRSLNSGAKNRDIFGVYGAVTGSLDTMFFRVDKNGNGYFYKNFILAGYGTGAKTAAALGKTESIYRPHIATDGTVVSKAAQNGLASTTTDASGDITVTFATAMPDATYTALTTSENLVGNASHAVHSKTSTEFKIRTYHGGSAVGAGTSVTYSWSATDY